MGREINILGETFWMNVLDAMGGKGRVGSVLAKNMPGTDKLGRREQKKPPETPGFRGFG
jgi:hypothetical protein